MHHDSSKHGRHLDEAMRRETLEMIRGGVPDLRAGWPPESGYGIEGPVGVDRVAGAEGADAVDPADDLAGGLDRHAPGRGPGCPAGMTPREVAWRSELARALTAADFPADRNRLLARLARADAPDEIVAGVAELPTGRTFDNVGEVVRALGIHTEHPHTGSHTGFPHTGSHTERSPTAPPPARGARDA